MDATFNNGRCNGEVKLSVNVLMPPAMRPCNRGEVDAVVDYVINAIVDVIINVMDAVDGVNG